MKKLVIANAVFVVLVLILAGWFIKTHPPCVSQPVPDSLIYYRELSRSLQVDIDEREHAENIRSREKDSTITKKYESKNLVFRNTDMDSLYRDRVRTIKRLSSRQPPY